MKTTPMQQIDDFLLGQSDCKEGKKHIQGSKEYDLGYRCQEELQKTRKSELSELIAEYQ